MTMLIKDLLWKLHKQKDRSQMFFGGQKSCKEHCPCSRTPVTVSLPVLFPAESMNHLTNNDFTSCTSRA